MARSSDPARHGEPSRGRSSYPPPDPVAVLRALLRFDTSNPPGNERPCLELVGRLLEEGRIGFSFLAHDPSRPNLVARLRGRGEAPPLLLYGHVDVVPADAGEWRHPPFSGDLVDGDVWGRGALDMKGGVAMLVSALLRARSDGFEPAGDVILALTSDEETGSQHGAKFLVDDHPDLFSGVRYAISEFGGATQWISGRRFYPIQVSEKQACVIRATVRGKGGHGSSVVRGTAVEKLARFLLAVETKRLPVRVTPIVRRMLASAASELPIAHRLALRPLVVPKFTNAVLAGLGESAVALEALLRNTARATVIRGGDNTNVVPTRVTVELDGRLVPGQTPADLVRELAALAPQLATYEIVREEPAVPAEPDLTLFPLLSRIIEEREVSAVALPTLIPAYTDARHFARLGIQTYGFLPMRLPKHITLALIHAPNERIPAEAVYFGADCVYEVIRRYSLNL